MGLEDGNRSQQETSRHAEPFVGTGAYQRKSELRAYISITSTDPLRAYFYKDPWVSLSPTLYHNNFTSAKAEKCAHDSHAHGAGCRGDGSLSPRQLLSSFSKYASNVNISHIVQNQMVSNAKHILSKVMEAAKPFLKEHPVNHGISESGASCFSFMRADFGMKDDLSLFLYEINEFPFANQKSDAGIIQRAAYHDLFNLVGITEPPLRAEDRPAFELSHLGGWEPVYLDDQTKS